MKYISTLTQESREANKLKSIATKASKKAEREASAHLYKTEYMDSSYWQELAIKYSIRMPNTLEAPTLKWMRKYLNRLSIFHTDWCDSCGYSKVEDFITLNPKHTLYAAVGNMLEHKEAGNRDCYQ